MGSFPALVVREAGKIRQVALEAMDDAQLPPGEVTVAVQFSSLNYKDGLAITGKGPIIRYYPMVPGIDLAGRVIASDVSAFAPGDPVLVTGWGIGEEHWGGYAGKARVRADWLVRLPANMTARQAMGFGTAGFTAMLAMQNLEAHGVGREREILVTGAGGGVGGVAVALLSRLGYRVAASTGRHELDGYLKSLGAASILDRAELAAPSRPLLRERWGGVVDTVGGQTLATVLAGLAAYGCAVACGLVGGSDLPATVFPFLLRGVALVGAESAHCPGPRRVAAWQRLAEIFPEGLPEAMVEEIDLADVPAKAEAILAGRTRGRVVVRLGSSPPRPGPS